MDRYHFHGSHLDVTTFDLVDGFDAYADHLNTAFPTQKKQIQALMDMLHRSARHLDRLDFLYADQPSDFWIDQTEALGTIFDSLGCSPGLRAVFGMPSVLIGVPPPVCPQFFHANDAGQLSVLGLAPGPSRPHPGRCVYPPSDRIGRCAAHRPGSNDYPHAKRAGLRRDPCLGGSNWMHPLSSARSTPKPPSA